MQALDSGLFAWVSRDSSNRVKILVLNHPNQAQKPLEWIFSLEPRWVVPDP